MLSVFRAGSGWYMVGVLDAAARAAVAPVVMAAAVSSARRIDVMKKLPRDEISFKLKDRLGCPGSSTTCG
jgi:hypothetical protein